MSMRRLFGISCACLVTSACAIGKTPEKSISRYPSEDGGFSQGSEEDPTIKSSSLRWGATHEGWSVDYSSRRVAQRCESSSLQQMRAAASQSPIAGSCALLL